MNERPRILAVDDEEFNLDILEADLEDAGFEVIRAEDGVTALEKLEQEKNFDIILLDRMMPRMDGMQVLAKLKADPVYRNIPVIMQTAAAQSQQILEGIQAGAYYYLAKPYEEEMLIGIINAALNESRNQHQMQEAIRKHTKVMGLIEHARFRFRTLEEARSVAYYIANCCPDPENTVIGLGELMVNAIEHGNLGITYKEKTALVLKGKWNDEVANRLASKEYQGRYATLTFEAGQEAIAITIKDQGDGFDWEKYMEFDPERLTDPHGRGIAMANAMSFSSLEYRGCGNEVICKIDMSNTPSKE